jgi:ketosteroid isomerase-like protein
MQLIETVVASFNQAWNEHDLPRALSMCSDDIVFDASEPGPDGRKYRGKAEVEVAWKTIFDDPTARFRLESSFVCDDRLVQAWRYDWEGGHVRGIDIIRVRDGLITEKLSYVKG